MSQSVRTYFELPKRYLRNVRISKGAKTPRLFSFVELLDVLPKKVANFELPDHVLHEATKEAAHDIEQPSHQHHEAKPSPQKTACVYGGFEEEEPDDAESGYMPAAPSLGALCTQTANAGENEKLQCYKKSKCDHRRHVGRVEIQCFGRCRKWFHKECLYDYNLPDVPFMIACVFFCRRCSKLQLRRHREWLDLGEHADLDEVCVSALATLTCKWLVDKGKDVCNDHSYEVYFDVKQICEQEIKVWRESFNDFDPAKVSEELTVQILEGYPSLFVRNPANKEQYALREKDLSVIGSLNEDIAILLMNRLKRLQLKPIVVDEHAAGMVVLPPQEYRLFFRVELDPAVVPRGQTKAHMTCNTMDLAACNNVIHTLRNRRRFEKPAKERPALPTFACRLVHPKEVTLSPIDCDSWLMADDGLLTVTGLGLGGSTVRATHAVANGAWYFEAKVLEHPPGSAVRVGWSQLTTRLDTSLGAQKNAYSWHSLTGKKFNDTMGHPYTDVGYEVGDVIGCLISLPDVVGGQRAPPPNFTFSDFLPPSQKNESSLVAVGNSLFFECTPESPDHIEKYVIPNLPGVPDSKIEFFKNGQPCGLAFEGLCFGAYYPAISIYGQAKVRCNFGPSLMIPANLDEGVRLLSDRAEQIHVEQAVSDLVDNTIALSELLS